MKGNTTGFIAKVMVVILLFVLVNAFYQGVTTKPGELDSLYYHIPIANSYLDGRIFSSPKSPILHRFFPGASEGILALLILLHLPLNLYNVLAVVSLFAALYYLAGNAGLKRDLAVIFAASICLMTGITRWLNVQTVDIWMAVWYAGALALLLKPQPRWHYTLGLGVLLGMIIGTKYSGPGLAFFLLLFTAPGLIKKLKLRHYLLVALPILILGGFWYIRNLLVMGNPLYPLAFLALPGVRGWALEEPVWKAFLDKPFSFASAVLSEFFLWPLIILGGLVAVIIARIKKQTVGRGIVLLFILSFLNLLVYIFLPNGQGYTVHVSNLRYSYPVLIPGILAVFLLAKGVRKIDLLILSAFFQVLFSIQVAYHPKLLFVFIPFAFFVWKKAGELLSD